LFDQIYDSLPGGYEYPVWSYQEGSWLKSRRDNYGNLDTIEPGHAYWINLTSADILYGYGDKLIAATSPPETSFTTGWNLIGHYGLLSVPVVDALTSLVGYYDTVLDKDGNPVTGNLNPGEGYWVSSQSMIEGQVLQYTPSTESYNFN
jgi:hypothetical protein